MAGIGFSLRKIARQDSLVGVAQALILSSFIASGPWIVSVIALAVISMVVNQSGRLDQLHDFRGVLMYNSQFCPILVSSLSIISTRYFADQISLKKAESFSGLLFGGLVCILLVTIPGAALLYFYLTDLSTEVAAAAVINFVSIGLVWYLAAFASAIRDHLFVCAAFLVGATLATILTIYSLSPYGTVGMLISFSLGFLTVAALLLSRLLSMFSPNVQEPFRFLLGFIFYPELALGSLFFSIAVWVDKWIMWIAPEATHTLSGFNYFNSYDTTMFLAGLAGIPVLGLFILIIETGFYEKCLAYHSAILEHCPLETIEPLRKDLVSHTLRSMRSYLVLQGSLTALLIFFAPRIFEALTFKFEDLGMFRFALFGNFCLMLIIFVTTLLSYFDARRSVCAIQGCFLVLNAICTYYSLRFGHDYYGYGFFIATAVSAAVGIALIARTLDQLPYHTFILSNKRKFSTDD